MAENGMDEPNGDDVVSIADAEVDDEHTGKAARIALEHSANLR